MLSFGIEASFAFWTALPSVAFVSGSPPPSRAATVIARASFVNAAPRRASTIAFLCLIPAHLECPAMGRSVRRPQARSRRRGDGSGERVRVRAVPVDRAPQPLVELDARLPSGQRAQLGGVDVLAV